MSLPDQEYIKAIKRIPTLFFSTGSLDTFERPLRIWAYNHWDEPIRFEPQEVQFRVFKIERDGLKDVVDLDIIDAKTKHKRLELESGETSMVEWDRKGKDGKYVGKGEYRIIYLPLSTEDSRYRLSYSI